LGAGFAAGLAGAFAGATATVFLGSALAATVFALAASFGASLPGFAATALDFLTSGWVVALPGFTDDTALDFLDVVTGTGELTLGMDFLGTALDTATGVALALTVRDFLSGAALFAFAGTVGLEALMVLLFAFAGVLLLIFLLIVALFFSVNLTATAFLAGAIGFFTATTFFGLGLTLLFTLACTLLEAAFVLLVTTAFLAGTETALVLTAPFATGLGAVLAAGLAAALTTALAGLAIAFLAATGLALDAGVFFTGKAFFATGFLAAGLDAFLFFGVGMVQPSVMKRIGWRHQQSHALADKRRPLKDKTGTLGASCAGEHLGCSPCGRMAWVIGVTAWPVPEVLLSLLPKKTDYTNFTDSNSSISAFLRVSKVR
jgi:hypothetical protein